MSVTLIDVVQRYLNATDGFWVDSIADSDEAERVALIAQEVYERVVQDTNYNQYKRHIGKLDSVSDSDLPNYLYLDDDIFNLSESTLYYNVATSDDDKTVIWKELIYLEPLQFLRIVNANSYGDDDTTLVTDPDGQGKLVILSNSFPTYFTSFNGKYIVFDSYNSSEEDTLTSARTQIVYYKADSFSLEDDFVIPLPPDMIQGYIDMVKAEASETIRQESLPSATRRARSFLIGERFKNGRTGNKTRRGRVYGRNKGQYKGTRGRD